MIIIPEHRPGIFPPRYPVDNAITRSNPLAYWPMIDEGNRLIDTANLNRLTNSGSIPVPLGRKFDGTDDYCRQIISASGSGGTYYLSAIADNAFLWAPGVNFSSYMAPSLNNKPYMLILTDTSGNFAAGYVGGTGNGETLGAETISNGDFSAWTDDNPDNWNAVESGSGQITQNPAGQCQIIRPASGDSAYISKTLTIGKLYKYSINVTNYVSGSLGVQGNSSTPIYLTINSAGVKTGYLTIRNNTSLFFYPAAGTDITIDDVSFKQVTSPPANESVLLYSTQAGSTQSLSHQASGYKYEANTSYEIRRTAFQIVGELSMGAWIWIDPTLTSSTFEGKLDSGIASTIGFGYWLASSGGDLQFYLRNGTTSYGAVTSGAAYRGAWHFVVGVYKPSTYVRLYIDGKLANENTTSIPASINDVIPPFTIGCRWSSGAVNALLKGIVGDAFIFNRVLSQVEQEYIFKDIAWKYRVAS